ncbi:hypothetical protein ACD661_12365 [Legionella lytica]|uniref:Ankyrin repeats (3 copies) n=1 Tax=Legionella lytica TaxID=96232 RepID=A0ABW8D9I1_9GAMM
MAKFKSLEERMKHKQGKLIPASMWKDNQLFNETLEESVISIMKAGSSEATILSLDKYKSKLNDQWKKKQAWLGIALAQPNNFSLLEETAKKLEFNKKTLFSLFAVLGNLVFLDTYTKQFQSSQEVLDLIKDNEFYAYRKGAEHGHAEILNYLESKASSLTREMILAENYAAYKNAASNGHVAVLKDLEAKASELVIKMIEAQNYYAFRMGAKNGHISVLSHLESKAPQLFEHMVEADNFRAYRASVENAQIEASHWLLSKSSRCFAYAEAHVQEFGKASVNPFISQHLSALHREALNFPPPGVFDIQSLEQAKICFYLVRNLIRRNERALDDEIKFLLNLPSVKALAHMAVTPEQPNELIRLALTTGNQDAATILLNIPEVKSLTEENDYYRAEARGELDLSQLCKDGESSMTALTTGEQKRLDDAIKRYGPTLKSRGMSNLMSDLRAQLIERYTANPASIVDRDGKRIILPMDFAEFKHLKLKENEYQLALKAYYQNKDHSAWRYLSKPNPWMHPDAEYVYQDKKTLAKWSTFEDYQPLIGLLWLAAKDKETEPTEGHTFESRLNHYVDELALIGRSHNWDKTRVTSKEKLEEYDDLEGDRPSCYSGVKRRLFQSVLGHPLISIVTEDVILGEVRNFAREHFQSCIREDNKAALKAAFEDYIININNISEPNKNLLTALNISAVKQREFEHYLTTKYGAQYSEDFVFMNIVRTKMTLSASTSDFFGNCHALMLDGTAGLYQMLESPAEQKQEKVKVGHIGFFKPKPKETTLNGVDDTLSAHSSSSSQTSQKG